MNKLRNFFNKLMQGRYGADSLGQFLVFSSFILSLIEIFVKNNNARAAINVYVSASLIISIMRMFSKNINDRYQENIKFLKITKPVRAQFQIWGLMWRDRKTHRYVKCDKCKTYSRVPKGIGKVKIRCKNCGNEFIKRV